MANCKECNKAWQILEEAENEVQILQTATRNSLHLQEVLQNVILKHKEDIISLKETNTYLRTIVKIRNHI